VQAPAIGAKTPLGIGQCLHTAGIDELELAEVDNRLLGAGVLHPSDLRREALDASRAIQRHREVAVLVGVDPDCDHCLLLILVELGDVEAAGQSCVERCQASMKSRRRPWTAAGDESPVRHWMAR
jgi:hypothetical protein